MIKPWFFEAFQSFQQRELDVDRQATQERFRHYLDLWVHDEELGFEGIFFSEHHFVSGSFCPSPNLLVAHVAARTTRLRLGVIGLVSALATPWRIVEEACMLDHMTAGRHEMGVVSGIAPEMAPFGIALAEAVERHAETMEVVQKAFESPVIQHEGKYWRLDGAELLPKPLQQPAPPRWTAASSTASAERAGRGGWKLCAGFTSLAAVKDLFDHHQAAARAAGQPTGPDTLGLRRQVFILEDGGDKARVLEKARADLQRRVVDRFPGPGGGTLFKVPDDDFIVGTAEEVAAEIIHQCRSAGAGHFVAMFTAEDFDATAAAHEAFGKKVIPALRQASVSPEPAIA